MESRIYSYLRSVQDYELPDLRNEVLKAVPVDKLRAETQEAIELCKEFGEIKNYEECLVETLALWFKGEFFEWVDRPSCWHCGANKTELVGMSQPDTHEEKHKASRTEIYQCGQCAASVRFPRYNDPAKLVQTRKGRCGEWANAFTCICRCFDLEARFVVDWTDHVWTEVYIPDKRRWIHVDCCECVIDQPSLYEKGWGKRLSYVIAFDRYGPTDVTKKYVADWDDITTRRKEIEEGELENLLDGARRSCRRNLGTEEFNAVLDREETDVATPVSNGILPGRTTGSIEWRESRGEVGNDKAIRPSTCRIRRIEVNGRRLAVRPSGEKPINESVVNLFDGNPETKWLDFGGGGLKGSSWIEFRVHKSDPPIQIFCYAMTSANDCPERDPAEWEFQAFVNEEWKTVERQEGIIFPARHHVLTFDVEFPECRRLRLCIWKTADPSKSNSVQLAQLEF